MYTPTVNSLIIIIIIAMGVDGRVAAVMVLLKPALILMLYKLILIE